MPLTKFLCPDKEEVLIEDCLVTCRIGQRCMSLPTLRSAASDRILGDNPRVTASQGGTGVRQLYLQATNDYTTDPQSRADLVFGKKAHFGLESETAGELLSEEHLENEYTSCTIDLYDGYDKTLIDYKTWGSYKIKKALGLVEKKVPDPDGAVYLKNTKYNQKGDPKMVSVWETDPAYADMWETDLQMNLQRILVEAHGWPVERMFVEAYCKETRWFAKKSGIDRKIYLFPVKKLPDKDVESHYRAKTMQLREALKTGVLPPICTQDEHWDGRKCEFFCDVAHICNPPWLDGGEDSEDWLSDKIPF